MDWFKITNSLNELRSKQNNFKQAKESGGVGYVDDVRSISWDGDLTGRTVIDNGDGTFLVRISETVVDLKEITTVYKRAHDSAGQLAEQTKVEDFTVIGDVTTEQGIVMPDGTVVVGIVSDEIAAAGLGEAGVYVWYLPLPNGAFFISRIEFAETIHPIDPKFLPNNILGEDIWGDHVEAAFDEAFSSLMSNGTSGVGLVEFTVDDADEFAQRCITAETMRWSMRSMSGVGEAHIAAKTFFDTGRIRTLSAGAIVSVSVAVVNAQMLISVSDNEIQIIVWLSTLNAAP